MAKCPGCKKDVGTRPSSRQLPDGTWIRVNQCCWCAHQEDLLLMGHVVRVEKPKVGDAQEGRR